MAATPFLYSCTSAFGISKLFKHQNSLKSVHSHQELQVGHTKGHGEIPFYRKEGLAEDSINTIKPQINNKNPT